jgi:putative OPT family oligopeptide transporter
MKRLLLPVVFGLGLTAVLSGTFVIAGLKAGITPGVSPLVILSAWGIFAARAGGREGTRFLNLAQVAGSGGMAVTAGVIFTAPVIQIVFRQRGLEPPPVDVVSLIILSLSGALIGFGFVGLTTRKFLSDPSLPAPEARACTTMIRAASTDAARRPLMGRSLFAALGLGVFATLATKMGLMAGGVQIFSQKRAAGDFTVALPLDALLIGIGGLLTLPTALLIFGGAMVRMTGEYLLGGFPPGSAAAANFVDVVGGNTEIAMRWLGGGTMLVAVCYSLVKFLRLRAFQSAESDQQLLEVDPVIRQLLTAAIVLGMAVLVGWLASNAGIGSFMVTMAFTVLVMAMLMTTLGAILSLQIGSSASPVSGTIFVTTLVLCLAALAVGHASIDDVLILTPLTVGACVAVCAANDSSQDYKTLQLSGMRVQEGFLAQLLGLCVGAVVVPSVLYVADRSFGLGSEALPAPQGKMFSTLVDGLLLESRLPWYPIAAGLVLGVFAVGLEIFSRRRSLILPAMALAVGIYLPAAIGTGILTGAVFRFLGERGRARQTNESILSAAGLITGSAALELILGIAILAGFEESGLELFHSPGTWTAGLGISAVGGLLWWNSRFTAAACE